MKIFPLIVVAVFLVSEPLFAEYKQPFSVEFHSGPVFSSDGLTSVDIDDGVAFGATFSYYFLDNRFGLYTGFDLDLFEADSTNNTEIDAAILYGYSFGVEYRGAIPDTKLGYFGRGGVHVSKLQLLDEDDDDLEETKFDAGFETSAGLTYDLGTNWALRGAVRYKTFSRKFRNSVSGNSADLESTSLLFGAMFNF